MLVLNRKINESIVIDGNIKVTVVRLRRGNVTVGIDAPRLSIAKNCLVRFARP